MAGNDTTEEFVAVSGIFATAPITATGIEPASATEELDPAWIDHGLITAAGITRSEPTTSTPRYAWQNNTRLRTLVTQAAVRWQTILVQASMENIELFNGTELVDGSLVVDPQREFPHLQFCLDLTDGDKTHREYAPDVQIVERGDQVALAGDTYGWPVTLESVYNDEIGGHTVQFFSEFEGS